MFQNCFDSFDDDWALQNQMINNNTYLNIVNEYFINSSFKVCALKSALDQILNMYSE